MAPARKKQRLSDGAAIEAAAPAAEESEVLLQSKPSTKATETAQDQHQRSLFVRSLPASTTSDSLTQLFSESYPVKHAVAVTDPATKQCRGYGFVTFADVEDAQKAKNHFNGHLIDGKKLRVELAERRHREGDDARADDAKTKREEERKEVKQPPKLIVRNLPWTIKTSEQLTKLFQSYGKVKKAYLPKKNAGGLLPGFGFVLMRGRKNAEKAIEGVNGKEIDGRTLAVDWSVDKETYQKANAEVGDADKAADTEENEDDEESDVGGVEVEDMDAEAGEDMLSDSENDGSDDHSEHSKDATSQDQEEKEEQEMHKQEDKTSTIFVRNLPFTCTDEDLEDHFSQFGATRYARVVLDHQTGRPKGTGFVCFYDKDNADTCLRGAPRGGPTGANATGSSILQNTSSDTSGQYTLDGRVLVLSRAVEKSEANRLTDEGTASRTRRDRDKRRLYLLSEGTIATNTKMWESLPPSEQTMREASLKQRKALIESNPSLNLSLTRLSIRNIPRSITSKDLKQLAREAVVGFATEVKEGKRQRLTREELERAVDEMTAADEARKAKGKGIVRQAKVVFEGEGGGKVDENSGAGRSRGYGFVEYYTHRSALMGLRWLNGHSVGYQVKDAPAKGGKADAREALQDRKKRLIVEFAIENAQVMHRRQELEKKARERSKAVQDGKVLAEAKGGMAKEGENSGTKGKRFNKSDKNFKRKRVHEEELLKERAKKAKAGEDGVPLTEEDKLAKRNRIIGRKRQLRRAKASGRR